MAPEARLQVETPQRRTGLRVQEGWECFLLRETKLGRARWQGTSLRRCQGYSSSKMIVRTLVLEPFHMSVIHHWYFRWLSLQRNLKTRLFPGNGDLWSTGVLKKGAWNDHGQGQNSTAEESGRQRTSHRKESRNKANTVGYMQLSYGDFSEARMGLRVALRPSHRTGPVAPGQALFLYGTHD